MKPLIHLTGIMPVSGMTVARITDASLPLYLKSSYLKPKLIEPL